MNYLAFLNISIFYLTKTKVNIELIVYAGFCFHALHWNPLMLMLSDVCCEFSTMPRCHDGHEQRFFSLHRQIQCVDSVLMLQSW